LKNAAQDVAVAVRLNGSRFQVIKMKHYAAISVMLAVAVTFCAAAQAQPQKAAKKLPLVTPASDVTYSPLDPKDTKHNGVMVHVIYGNLAKKGPVAFLARIPAGYSGGPHAHGSDLYLTTISGNYFEWRIGEPEGQAGGAGGTIFVPAKTFHNNRCEKQGGPCLNYAYYPNGFDIIK